MKIGQHRLADGRHGRGGTTAGIWYSTAHEFRAGSRIPARIAPDEIAGMRWYVIGWDHYGTSACHRLRMQTKSWGFEKRLPATSAVTAGSDHRELARILLLSFRGPRIYCNGVAEV
jgi:hypothetical protein